MKKFPMKNRLNYRMPILSAWMIVLMLFGAEKAQAQCVMVCRNAVKIVLSPGETQDYNVISLLEVPSNCPNPIYSFSDMPEDTIRVLRYDEPGPRTYMIIELMSGNSCWTQLSVVPVDCEGDTEKPVFNSPPSDITIGCDDPIPAPWTATATDNCDTDLTYDFKEIADGNNCPGSIRVLRTWTATDDNINQISHTQNIYSSSGRYRLNIPSDYTGICGEDFMPEVLSVEYFDHCDLLGTTFEDTHIVDQFCLKILRKHTVIDWCYDGTDAGMLIPTYDSDSDGQNEGYSMEVDAVSRQITYPAGVVPTQSSAPNLFEYTQIIKLASCNEPTPVCRNISSTVLPGETLDAWASDFDAGSFDNCIFEGMEFRLIWADSSNQSTPPGSAFLTYTSDLAGIHQVELWVGDADGNWDYCTADFEIIVGQQTGNFFTGNVFSDADGDCIWNENTEEGLDGWLINIIGLPSGEEVSTVASGLHGQYSISLPDVEDTLYRVSLISNINYGQQCPTVYEFKGEPGFQLFEKDIPVVLSGSCPLMAVDISTNRLRRCFPSVYYVNYCNYGAESAMNATVEVQLDSFLNFQNASVTPISIQGNLYTFYVGDVAPGDCGRFSIQVEVSCAAVLGQTHCSSAHVFPDTLCGTEPQWSGASIEAKAVCRGDSVRLSLENTGKVVMAEALDFVIIEDMLMYRQGTFQLDAGQVKEFSLEASGATWNLQAEQEPFHPYADEPSLSIEGCVDGSVNVATRGLVNQFAQRTGNGFTDIDCQENIGSYDPNDKQATPVGYGDRFRIDQNIDLEYKIRFQNTGTDTAFTVRIEDRLSEHLDVNTVIPGASSHEYTFTAHEDGTLIFLFENIMLPDSFINEPASNGFVNFKVSQKTNVELETVIPNTADIFFDFNDPVRTNEVLHTVGLEIATVSVENMPEELGFAVHPNPFESQTTFKLNENISGEWILEIFDLAGKRVTTEKTIGPQMFFERKNMTEGVYFFKIKTEDGRTGNGKIIVSN